ncbi:MAG: fructosamine kinase [Frankiales bacterium]|nr:fructosamine kinase [Frankiales bacterium]
MGAWTKRRADAPLGAFVAEAAGLDFIRVEGGPPVPRVHDVTATAIRMDEVITSGPTAATAEDLGRRLAVLHACPAPAFGAPWTGFIGPTDDLLPMDNMADATWAEHFATRRVLPALKEGRDRRRVDPDDAAAVEAVLDRLESLVPDPGPRRVHGDLWSGNVLWALDAAWLIDPAAHGGHPETDLAMLQLFGLPFLDSVLSTYSEAAVLAPGWRERTPVHQLWPLLVHAALFGGDYGARAGAAARSLR